MTADARETRITVDADVPIVRTTREFDATPRRVFRAHVDPDLLIRWFGPRGTELHLAHWDCRTGGSYRYTHVVGDQGFTAHGAFHEVRDDERIVQTFEMAELPGGVALERQVFEPLDGDRCRLTIVTLVESFVGRDAMVASGMEHGMRESFERLDELLPG